MAQRLSDPGPIGRTAAQASRQRAARSPEYRRLRKMTAPYQDIAWQLVKYRMDQGLTQEQLAELVGTSHSQISRVESGRHAVGIKTLARIADALGLEVLVRLQPRSDSAPMDGHESVGRKGRAPSPTPGSA